MNIDGIKVRDEAIGRTVVAGLFRGMCKQTINGVIVKEADQEDGE